MGLSQDNEKDKLKEEYKTMAEFLGYYYKEFTPGGSSMGWHYKEDRAEGKFTTFLCRNTLKLDFRYDWSILMKVVAKIEELENTYHGGFYVVIQGNSCTIQSRNKGKEGAYSCTYSSPSKIKAVYESCIRFINQNKNKLN